MDRIKGLGLKYRVDIFYFLLITAVYLFLIIKTYAKWGFPIIDSFRSAYVAEQILLGKVLYVDLSYPYGPLIQYFLSFLFKIFGINLNILYMTGIITTLIILISFYLLSRQILNSLESFIVMIFIMINFLFSPGIHNFIFPYSYEALFGCLLSIILILLCLHCLKNDTNISKNLYILSSIVVLLTLIKQDFAISSYVIYIIFLILTFKLSKISKTLLAKNVLIIIISPILLYGILSMHIGIKPLFEGLMPGIGGFIFNYEVPNQATYYTNIPGLSYLSLSAVIDSVSSFISFVCIFSFMTGFFYLFINLLSRLKFIFQVILSCLSLFIVLFGIVKLNIFLLMLIQSISNPLLFQWIGLFLIIYLVFNLFKGRGKIGLISENQYQVLFLAFSGLVLIFRSPLSTSSTTISNYTCIIAFLFLFYFIIKEISKIINPCENSKVYKSILLSLILFTILIFQKNIFVFSTINSPIISSKGTIYVHDEYFSVINQAISFVRNNAKEDDTILAVPEEIIINFMSERSSPTKYYQLIPCFSSIKVQKEVIQDLTIQKPLYIMISNSPINYLYNKKSWGEDYQSNIYSWIKANYIPYKVFRDPKDKDNLRDYYKIYTFKRKDIDK